jgi:hypothetical protein
MPLLMRIRRVWLWLKLSEPAFTFVLIFIVVTLPILAGRARFDLRLDLHGRCPLRLMRGRSLLRSNRQAIGAASLFGMIGRCGEADRRLFVDLKQQFGVGRTRPGGRSRVSSRS